MPRVAKTEWQIYSDSDHAGDRQVNQTRSVTGVMVICNGILVHWRSNKQPISSISSTAAEIYALAETRDAETRTFDIGSRKRWKLLSSGPWKSSWITVQVFRSNNQLTLIQCNVVSMICESNARGVGARTSEHVLSESC